MGIKITGVIAATVCFGLMAIKIIKMDKIAKDHDTGICSLFELYSEKE